ncbi:MAG: nicotinate-nucleotide--dimethylbenzimidazole phosphoribosyltransferase [Lachnospiraceae bacterium]|nr:nicotinate-nucleotide--dimethylbenzimidazole phosphoribosyltransferase [Lachnospiraceae bacterium]
MNRQELFNLSIDPPDEETAFRVRARWDAVAKPLDALGRFEEMTIRIGAMLRDEELDLSKKTVVTFCADNGIVAEGVTQTGQSVTAAVAESIAAGTASVSRMAETVGAGVLPVDIGINSRDSVPGVLNRRVRAGTENFLETPAMTEEECLRAIECGMEIAEQLKVEGVSIIASGEMGIGNTTTGSAVAAALLGLSASLVTGKGAGLSESGFKRKIEVIDQAVGKYGLHKTDPLAILYTVGGLDIAGMTGLFIGGALFHLPVVVDGMISAAAALLAERLVPGVKEYMLASHMGKERACRLLLSELSLVPVIDADLALGEGTGAVMLFSLLDQVLSVYHGNTTFSKLFLKPYERFEGT